MSPARRAPDKKDPTKPITTWPAVILAVSRKQRVRGRTRILKVSTKIRAGLSHIGAPAGKRWAAAYEGDSWTPEIIKLAQIGRPRDKLNKRWDENLKA